MKTIQQRFYQGAVIQQNKSSPTKTRPIKPYFRTPTVSVSGDLTNPYTKTNFTWNETTTPQLRTIINEFNGYLNIDLNTSLPNTTTEYLEIEGGIDVLNVKNISALENLTIFTISFTNCMLIDLSLFKNDVIEIRLIYNNYCFDYILPDIELGQIEITRDKIFENEPATNIWCSKMDGSHVIVGNVVNTEKIYVHLPVGSSAGIVFIDYKGEVITLYDYDENLPSNETPLEY